MADTNRPPGKTTVAPSVLETIVRAATLQVEGVSRFAPHPSGVDHIFKRGQSEGIRIKIKEDQRVYADIYVILTDKVNVRVASKNIQKTVNRAISKMVGKEVGAVNRR
ncbi:MAG: hypothetical protein B5M51_07080 [Anaerolinea sp. 4484_236]|nr:MAG: hypothetical protein B5M51_07080 [Anaerolinea sp. 4484_236]